MSVVHLYATECLAETFSLLLPGENGLGPQLAGRVTQRVADMLSSQRNLRWK